MCSFRNRVLKTGPRSLSSSHRRGFSISVRYSKVLSPPPVPVCKLTTASSVSCCLAVVFPSRTPIALSVTHLNIYKHLPKSNLSILSTAVVLYLPCLFSGKVLRYLQNEYTPLVVSPSTHLTPFML